MEYKILVLLITRATQSPKFQSSNPIPVVRTALRARDAKKLLADFTNGDIERISSRIVVACAGFFSAGQQMPRFLLS